MKLNILHRRRHVSISAAAGCFHADSLLYYSLSTYYELNVTPQVRNRDTANGLNTAAVPVHGLDEHGTIFRG